MKKYLLALAVIMVSNSVVGAGLDCLDTRDDMGSGYIISGEDNQATPNIDLIRDIIGSNDVYLLFANAGAGATCSAIDTTDRMWAKNPREGISGIFRNPDGSGHRGWWDWFAFLWDESSQELCYMREVNRTLFWNCIDAAKYAANIDVCPGTAYAEWNVTSGEMEAHDADGQILLKKANAGGNNWAGAYVWIWNPNYMEIDYLSTDIADGDTRGRVYGLSLANTNTFTPVANGYRLTIFNYRKNLTDYAYVVDDWGLQVDAVVPITRHNDTYALTLLHDHTTYYCANYERDCLSWFNSSYHFDYATGECETGTSYISRRTYDAPDNVNRWHPEEWNNTDLIHGWLDTYKTTGNGTGHTSNLTFFRGWTDRPTLAKLYTSPGVGSCSTANGIYRATHGYRRTHPYFEAVFAFYDNSSEEVCIFKQDRVTTGNTSNETVWVEFKCAPLGSSHDLVGCPSADNVTLDTDDAYFYANSSNLSFMIAGFNNENVGLEYGGIVLVEYMNATDVWISGTHSTSAGGGILVLNASEVSQTVEWGATTGVSNHDKLSLKGVAASLGDVTIYYIYGGSERYNDLLGFVRNFWDFNFPYSWIAFNITDNSTGAELNGVVCTTNYGSNTTNASGFANITGMDYYGNRTPYNCSLAGYFTGSGNGLMNNTNNESLEPWECIVDADCGHPNAYDCVAHLCVYNPECDDDADCGDPASWDCIDYLCVPGGGGFPPIIPRPPRVEVPTVEPEQSGTDRFDQLLLLFTQFFGSYWWFLALILVLIGIITITKGGDREQYRPYG